jgi:hypothetical protein
MWSSVMDLVASGGDGVVDEVQRSAVNSRVRSTSSFTSSGEAEGWLEEAWAVGASGVGLRWHLAVK